MGNCRSCGRPIVWVQTKRGRKMPCDPEVIEVHIPAAGSPPAETVQISVVDDDGEIVRGYAEPPESLLPISCTTTRGRLSHFATCPNADEHRKRTCRS